MKIIVTQIGAGISTYPDLKKWARSFGDNPNSKSFEALKYLEGDPDKIKCDGNEMFFMDVDLNGVKYILTSDYANTQETEMLCRFHGDERAKYFRLEESEWSCYDTASEVIAYRGGVGYCYGIWSYSPTNNN